jgi:putative drug exporter of the RND superfamily
MNRQIAGWVTHHWVKWVVLVLSLLLIGSMGFLGSKLTSVQNNENSSWLPSDAESTRVMEEATTFADPDAVPAVVLYERDSGITQADDAKAAADVKRFANLDKVSADVIGPIPSKNGKALQTVVTYSIGADGWEALPGIVDELKTAASGTDGLDVSIAGPAAVYGDQMEAFSGIDGVMLLAALAIVFVILLITYRSLQLAILFLLCGVGAIATAQGVVYLLAKYADLIVNNQSSSILSVLVLGAGVDYALLLVARYREELHNFEDRHEAMTHALHRAAPAVLASGATVIVGLLCLMFAQMNSTSGLGPVGAVGIACALLIMLILLPALLVIVGRWIFWPFVPRFGDPIKTESGLWARIGHRIARRPRAVWITTSVVLGALAFGMLQLNANGLSFEESFTTDQPSITAEKAVARHFPAGAGNPVVLLTDSEATDEVQATVGNVQGIVPDSVQVKGEKDGRAYLEATLAAAPDSQAAIDTVNRVREAVHDVDGASVIVGGNTAVIGDTLDASAADSWLIIPIVLVAVFVILAILLRALLAPLVLLATVVLSFGAALGISALVFKHVFGFAGADPAFPLFAFVFLVALGIDYNIFLMTRVREEALRVGTRRGALIGIGATGGVITSAGFVLAGTFAALATLPIVFVVELGFAVAIGVLLDTIIVRSVLVTALNLDIGRHMWWPSALAQKPDVDTTELEREPESVRV